MIMNNLNKRLVKTVAYPAAALAVTGLAACEEVTDGNKDQKPNVILIYTDDMGYADIGAYGGNYTPTPNIDRIGQEGIQFNQYYSACPISSPSRVGVTTGMYPTQWGITTFLNDRAANYRNKSNDYLLTCAPTMAKSMKAGGYATGHFGKWHMGGGRDVDTPPQITEYGFDEYCSTWESPDPDPRITASDWIWSDQDEIKRWDRTAYFVDKTLDFLRRHKGEPCFVNLWPDDMHTPYVPSKEAYDKTNKGGFWDQEVNFVPVLAEFDKQIGRLLDGLDELGIADNTIIIFTSDNGPNPRYKNVRTGGMRGQKGTLYEGGIRLPFLIRWPDRIKPGQINDETVLTSIDLHPTVCAMAGIDPVDCGYELDGLDMSRSMLKKAQKRKSPMFWEFGHHFVGKDLPKNPFHTRSPNICVREGDWKLLVNYDGTMVELYNIANDKNETQNVAETYPSITQKLKDMAIDWYNTNFRRCAGELTDPKK